MREIEGAGILHKSDSDYNKNVVKAIKIAKQMGNARDCIDVLSKAKNVKEAIGTDEEIQYIIKESANYQEEIEEEER